MKEGLDPGHDKRMNRIQRLEDVANINSVILGVSRSILPLLVRDYELSNDDWNEMNSDLEKEFTKSTLHRPDTLRDLAVETIQDTMKRRGIEAPGLRDQFLFELEDRMKVRIE